VELATGAVTVLTPDLKWDVETLKLSPDGKTLAYVANEDGASFLHLWDVESARERSVPSLPLGVLTGLEWHSNGTVLGFSLSSAQSPADGWSLDVTNGSLTRWTESETGGLNAAQFRVPELIRTTSFDGLTISGFLYRPDPVRFPGPRPVLILIHGGPESQSRPVFLGRNNFLIDQLGIALLYPNVRGSSGYGKTFLTLDNGRLREDSVKDIGTFLNWLERDPQLDRNRVAVMGGSYGGYMTLASLVHFGSRLRAGIDIVGISSFVTFLENTQDYRRDLRRVEYGDERDPEMRAILSRISPLNQVSRIRTPLLVVQGLNDPRVPVTEAEQMVKALRAQGGTAWYLMAKDEGHGFAKKKNADFQFLSTLLFLEENLLE
jgi:dipeptidyl aminopeptidase/acylaminoacyl peptidase